MKLNLLGFNFRSKADIDYLREKGYRLNESSARGYWESLFKSGKRVEHLKTKIESKRKEIERLNTGGGKGETFESLMANLIDGLGYQVGDDITLAMYNEFKKIVKRKQAPKKQHGFH